ncbi:MAG TPA: histidine--tRNA ligase, partial [Methyloradius sp.]
MSEQSKSKALSATYSKFQSIKGFYDILPEQTALWQKLEDTARRVLSQYGYRNIHLPIVEPTDLFIRSVG